MAWRMLTAAVLLLLELQSLPGIAELLGAIPGPLEGWGAHASGAWRHIGEAHGCLYPLAQAPSHPSRWLQEVHLS